MTRRMPQVSPPGSFWSVFDRPFGWIAFIVFILCITGALLIQNRFVQNYKREPFIDQFSLPRPDYVKRVAIGYDAFMADMLFLRSIQAFGGVYENPQGTPGGYSAIFNYFDVISTLDPHFIESYNFGQLIMGDESNRYDLALRLLRKGQWYNWGRFQPWYDAAYIKTYPLKQEDNEAKWFIRQAAKTIDAPDWVSRLEYHIDERSGKFSLAMLGWIESYANSVDGGDTVLAGIARNRFASTISEWHKRIMQDAADAYLKKEGKPAASLEELQSAGYLQPVEVIDYDMLMQNLQMFEMRQGKLAPLVEQIYDNSVIAKGGILPNIVAPHDPFALICTEQTNERIIVTETVRTVAATRALEVYRNAIAQFRKQNQRYPQSLEELPLGSRPVDPYCAGWRYDPNSGLIVTPAREDL